MFIVDNFDKYVGGGIYIYNRHQGAVWSLDLLTVGRQISLIICPHGLRFGNISL